jgi:hypothetical protein
MKSALKWGLIFGLIAFIVNLLLPGLFEPPVALAAAFFAAGMAVRQSHVIGKRSGVRLGLVTSCITGLIIIVTDLLFSVLLVVGYLNKDKIPWVNLPENVNFKWVTDNILLIVTGVFLCMGTLKVILTLLGGALGGVIFARPRQ